MPAHLKVVITNSPQRRLLTDIESGKPRETTATRRFRPLDALLATLSLGPFTGGAGRVLFGNKPSNEARETLASRALEARIRGEEARAERAEAEAGAIREPPPARESEQGRARAKQILDLLPLDLARAEVDLEQQQAIIVREQLLGPVIEEARSEAIELVRERRRARAVETNAFLASEGARREREQVEIGILDAQEERLRLQTDLLARAGDPFLPESSRIAALQALTGRVVAPKPRIRPTQRFRLT